jgi:hypothetical protein
MDARTVLDRWLPRGGLPTWLGLWVIPILILQAAPASAQQGSPDSKAQPAPAAEASSPPAPAPSGAGSSPPAEPGSPAPAGHEAPGAPGGLEELLEEEVPASSVGSFGYRLRRYGINPYIHGVLTTDLWKWRRQPGNAPSYQGFDLRDAHLYFGADILELIIPELFLEFESNEIGVSGLFLRYAQLDLRLHEDLLILRTGLFLVPFGVYNTDSIPRFITKLPDRPAYFRDIVPTSWQEVGVQLMGKWEWRPGLTLSYAVYVTNGSEQLDVDDPNDPSDDGIDEGGHLSELENVFEEQNNNSKSFGARVRMEPIAGLAFGLSGYTGAYTKDGRRRLSMAGLDASYDRGPFSLDLETALIRQEVTGGALRKWGYVAVAAYRVHRMVEPVLAIDEVHQDGAPKDDGRTYWGGVNVFPFPDQIPTCMFKAAYGGTVRGDDAVVHRISVQLAVGY